MPLHHLPNPSEYGHPKHIFPAARAYQAHTLVVAVSGIRQSPQSPVGGGDSGRLCIETMGDAHPFSFISYTHPDQQAHRSNRRKALRHVGIHFRNRSRPAARRAAEKRLCGARRSVAKGSASGDDGDSRSEAPVVLAPPLWRDGLAYREDPFAVYPVERSPAIAPALDYCKSIPDRTDNGRVG